ncbi:ribonuclease HIII ['Fragaria x ananassa' phyllody phytoplasma]|uniref:Ribonuclease n=1 Tax='Fragaria x ananassa' phyllody phytoplasma TaxID=2358428 RepID=A0ABS5K4L0_9MOLU|nr:ribonuclease HIII ['Fragaria x ananassa' phyllody phytoplasma]MBS2126148.1 ribonuclease HIII ['Fragaria x ananassa' phyllody phytoplasma]
MLNYVLKLDASQFLKIKKFYHKQLQTTLNKDVAFVICDIDDKITVYRNYTLLVQGNKALVKMNFLKKLLQIPLQETNNFHHLDNFFFKKTQANHLSKNYYLESIGSDEVGTGDVFGPIVVCCVYLSPQNIVFLKKVDSILESKKQSDQKILQIAPLMIKNFLFSVETMMPEDYNKVIHKYNLNKIKSLLHNQAIQKTVAKTPHQVVVILDQFCNPQNYFQYLKDETTVYQKIHFETKADSHYLSVAAASIIARYFFLIAIDKIGKLVATSLKLGANKEVDHQIAWIVKQYGSDILKKIAKCNFRNIIHKFHQYL